MVRDRFPQCPRGARRGLVARRRSASAPGRSRSSGRLARRPIRLQDHPDRGGPALYRARSPVRRRDEIEAMLAATGVSVRVRFGDYDASPLLPHSPARSCSDRPDDPPIRGDAARAPARGTRAASRSDGPGPRGCLVASPTREAQLERLRRPGALAVTTGQHRGCSPARCTRCTRRSARWRSRACSRPAGEGR